MSLRSAAVLLAIAGCATTRYTDLPAKPRVPHDFFSLERRFVTVPLEGRAPVRLSYVTKGSGPPLVLVHGLRVVLDQTSHFTQVDAPQRTVEEILRFDPR